MHQCCHRRFVGQIERQATAAFEAIFLQQRTLPIGPLCPFRSQFWSAEAVNNYAAEMPIKQLCCTCETVRIAARAAADPGNAEPSGVLQ